MCNPVLCLCDTGRTETNPVLGSWFYGSLLVPPAEPTTGPSAFPWPTGWFGAFLLTPLPNDNNLGFVELHSRLVLCAFYKCLKGKITWTSPCSKSEVLERDPCLLIKYNLEEKNIYSGSNCVRSEVKTATGEERKGILPSTFYFICHQSTDFV